MKIPITERIAGTTIRTTMVSSGAVGATVSSALFDKNESLINSVAGVASGNGFYYAIHTLPKTPAWYANEWIAIINTNTYVDRQFIRGVHPEV